MSWQPASSGAAQRALAAKSLPRPAPNSPRTELVWAPRACGCAGAATLRNGARLQVPPVPPAVPLAAPQIWLRSPIWVALCLPSGVSATTSNAGRQLLQACDAG